MIPYILLTTLLFQNAYTNLVISTYETSREECSEINSAPTNIKCTVCENMVDCLLAIDKGDSAFGLISAEDAILAAPFLKNVAVIAEIRDPIRYTDKYQGEVVILTKNLTNSKLQNAKYCHIDYKPYKWVKYSTKIFLDYVLSTNDEYYSRINDNKCTISERRYKALNSVLGPSCLPDAKLPNLCKICSNQESCTYGVDGFNQTINCFNSGGNLAITVRTLSDHIKAAKYVCMDNSLSSKPCSWFSIPWPLIIANKNKIEITKNFLNDMFVKFTPENVGVRPYVRVLVNPQIIDVISFLDKTVTLDEYIGETHKIIPQKHTLRWCVTSESEVKKCQWINRAAFYGGIHLNITCERLYTREDCINNVMFNSADLTILKKNFSPLFQNKFYGIETIAYTLNYTPLNALILVKSTDVHRLEEKSGCFSGYNDEGFLAFFARRTDYDPGIHERLKNVSIATGESIMCNSDKCIRYPRKGGNIETALHCLQNHDFAVVIEDKKILSKRKDIFVLCGNKVSNYSNDLPDECYLCNINDQFIIRKDYVYKRDVLDLLTFIEGMERFKPFKPFAGEQDVLFEDKSFGIITEKPEDRNNPFEIIQSARDAMKRKRLTSKSPKHKSSPYLYFAVACVPVFNIKVILSWSF